MALYTIGDLHLSLGSDKTMEVFGVRTYRDVAELAFADCPAKTMLLQRLDVLNPDGPSYEKVQPPVQYEAHAQAAAEPSPSAADAPQAPAADAPQQEGVQSAGER